jgi:hypothetical protein
MRTHPPCCNASLRCVAYTPPPAPTPHPPPHPPHTHTHARAHTCTPTPTSAPQPCTAKVSSFEGNDIWLRVLAGEKAGLLKVDTRILEADVLVRSRGGGGAWCAVFVCCLGACMMRGCGGHARCQDVPGTSHRAAYASLLEQTCRRPHTKP